MQSKKNSGKKSVRFMRSVALSQLNMLKGLRLTSHASRLAVFILFAYLTGCAAPQQQVKRRYFWPAPPDTPKIEFVASYRDNRDFPRGSGQAFMESIVGVAEIKGLDKPWGIASDGAGKVYIVDTTNAQVVIFDLINYKVDTLGKGEYAGTFDAPIGIALDGAGNIYVSDPKKNKILAFAKDEKPLIGIGNDETLSWPTGMVVDDKLGRLYVANAHSHNVAVFDLSGKHLFSFGKRGDKDGEFNYPSDIDLDSHGNLVVADSMNARVQILDPDGKFIRKFGQRGDGYTDFQLIKGIAVDKSTDSIYTVDTRAAKFLIFDKEGNALLGIGGPVSVGSGGGKLFPGGFLLPADIMIDRNGQIFVVDGLNKRFQIFQIINEEWLKKNPIGK